MSALIYSKKQCPFCDRAKLLLNLKGQEYTETIIGEDILREDFMELFPDVKTVPLIFIDGKKIGGYEQLREYYDNRPEFLSE